MLSRRNKRLMAEKENPKKQRFAIKKFSVGVASVLIGATFAAFSNLTVNADDTTEVKKTAENNNSSIDLNQPTYTLSNLNDSKTSEVQSKEQSQDFQQPTSDLSQRQYQSTNNQVVKDTSTLGTSESIKENKVGGGNL